MPSTVAFIGLGIMGEPMAGHLQAAGHPLTVHTRTRARTQPLLDRGAKWAGSPAAAARSADFVFICVPDTPDVESVILAENGVLSAARKDLTVIDHSTISPSATRRMAQQLSQRGAQLLDAPVSGGDTGARNATLSIMVGGDEAAFTRAKPLFERMGKTITYCGPSGAGQLTKLVNQVLVSVTNLAVSEAMVFARHAGLDPQKTITAVSGGAAGSWQLSNLAPKMIESDFRPGFKIHLQQKDLRLAIEAAKDAGLNLAALNLVHALFDQAMKEGRADEGTQALYAVVSERARAST